MSEMLRCFAPLTMPDAPFGLLESEDLGGEPTLLKYADSVDD